VFKTWETGVLYLDSMCDMYL